MHDMNLAVVAQQDRWEDLYGCRVLGNAKQGGLASVSQKSALSSTRCWFLVWRLELPQVIPGWAQGGFWVGSGLPSSPSRTVVLLEVSW